MIHSRRSFDAVHTSSEVAPPPIDQRYASLVASGQADAARTLLGQGAPLSIVGSRNLGVLLRIAGLERKAIQYDTGNRSTAVRMTRHAISATRYVPVRVLLRKEADGRAVIDTTARPPPSDSSGIRTSISPPVISKSNSAPPFQRPPGNGPSFPAAGHIRRDAGGRAVGLRGCLSHAPVAKAPALTRARVARPTPRARNKPVSP